MDLKTIQARLDDRHRQYLHEPIFDGSTVVFVLLIIVAAIGVAAGG